MLDAVGKIDQYTEGMAFEDFVKDEKTIDAVIRQLTVIGEAAAHVPEDIISMAPGIPWPEIRGMRNVVVHEYFGVNTRIIWETVKKNLPDLRSGLETLQSELMEEG
jgi:uncharacterized protein with HEPN domain